MAPPPPSAPHLLPVPSKTALEEIEEKKLNMSKFAALMQEAQDLLALIDLEASVLKQGKAAEKTADEETLDALIEKATKAKAKQEVLDDLEEMKKAIEEKKAVITKLIEAMNADEQDKDLISALIDEAKEMGLGENPKVAQAQSVLARDKLVKEAKKALKKAKKSADPAVLSEALEKAIELGMEGDEVKEAKKLHKRLEEEQELASGVRAAMKALSVKADSKGGVTASDLAPLETAMEEARELGLSDESPFMKQAIAAKEKIELVLTVQASVEAALEGNSLRVMKRVLDKAEDADLGNSSVRTPPSPPPPSLPSSQSALRMCSLTL